MNSSARHTDSDSDVRIRPVEDRDLDAFYQHQRDQEALRMAAFQPRERDAFFAHWAKARANPDAVMRTIECGGEVAGNVVSWLAGAERLVGYWIDRAFWGRGVATKALRLFVAEVTARPLHAYVAKHNTGSIRVLEKCGFVAVRESRGKPAEEGGDAVDEVVFRLDEEAWPPS